MTSFCVLCAQKQCTLHHIISACDYALRSKRYTWRHDSVLAHIKRVLLTVIQSANEKKDQASRIPPLSASFTPAGTSGTTSSTKHKRPSMLDGAHDWKILVDFDKSPIVFPPEIYATAERPDIILWSISAKRVILIELTCPAEEGIEAAQVRKIARYTDLVKEINRSGWSANQFAIEVGARGYVALSTPRCLKRLGMRPGAINGVSESYLRSQPDACTRATSHVRRSNGTDIERFYSCHPVKTAINVYYNNVTGA